MKSIGPIHLALLAAISLYASGLGLMAHRAVAHGSHDSVAPQAEHCCEHSHSHSDSPSKNAPAAPDDHSDHGEDCDFCHFHMSKIWTMDVQSPICLGLIITPAEPNPTATPRALLLAVRLASRGPPALI